MIPLTEDDMLRYRRQIEIPNFGTRAQKCLKKAQVTVAGAGGLGSAVLTYLAAAGIGHIIIIDNDKVELSNLNRQILYQKKDINKSKVQCAVNTLKQLNPDIEIHGIEAQINKDNIRDLLKGTKALIDCVDNYHTRYTLNNTAQKLNIPLFHGACYGFEGRATTIIPKKTACLRCIVPTTPRKEAYHIAGPVAGTIGTIQATEVIKYFTGLGSLLLNKLLVLDSLFWRTELVDIERNPKCPDCMR